MQKEEKQWLIVFGALFGIFFLLGFWVWLAMAVLKKLNDSPVYRPEHFERKR